MKIILSLIITFLCTNIALANCQNTYELKGESQKLTDSVQFLSSQNIDSDLIKVSKEIILKNTNFETLLTSSNTCINLNNYLKELTNLFKMLNNAFSKLSEQDQLYIQYEFNLIQENYSNFINALRLANPNDINTHEPPPQPPRRNSKHKNSINLKPGGKKPAKVPTQDPPRRKN